MYLRTPKRYRPKKRRVHLISRRTIVFLLLIPALVGIGWLVWENRDTVRDSVNDNVVPAVRDAVVDMRTQVAPRPTPTATPNLDVAQTACRAAQQQGDLEEAIEQCTILAENRPNDVEIHFEVAHLLIVTSNQGRDRARLTQALEQAEKAINADPEAPHGWAIKGLALAWLDDLPGALAATLQARALDDTFAPAYAYLGEVYQDLGQTDLAESYLDQAIELPNASLAAADALRNKGKLYNSQGLYEEALVPYRMALQQAPHLSYIAVELAQNLVALDEYDEAVGVLTGALERNPEDPGVLWYLGVVSYGNGDAPSAVEYYSRCLDHNPNNVLCLSYLGGMQFFDHDYATAVSNLQRAIELGSEDPDDFYQLGQSLANLSRCQEALPYYREGYEIAAANQDEVSQQNFLDALQSCGATN